VLHCRSEIAADFKLLFESGELENFSAAIVEVDEPYVTEMFVAALFQPDERFQALGVDERACAKIHDEVCDVTIFDRRLDDLFHSRLLVIAGEFTLKDDDRRAIVVLTCNGHDRVQFF